MTALRLNQSAASRGKAWEPNCFFRCCSCALQLRRSQFGSHLMKGSRCLEAINDFPSINHDQTWSNVSLVWRMQVRVFYRRHKTTHTETDEGSAGRSPFLNWLVDTIDVGDGGFFRPCRFFSLRPQGGGVGEIYGREEERKEQVGRP